MIEAADHESVRVLRLDRGPVNALDLGLLHALTQSVVDTPDEQAIVLTGSGRAFCAGVDLKRLIEGGDPYLNEFLPALSLTFRAVFDHPGPVIAAVNGHAIAGGCVLAAAADVRIMSAGRIGVSELLVGVPFPITALEILRHVVGPVLTSMALTGRALTPAQATEIGLVDEVIAPDDLMPRAIELATSLAQLPSATFAHTKQQLHSPATTRIDQLAPTDDKRTLELWASPEVRASLGNYLAALAKPASGATTPS